jgi:hypothetical protein
MSKAKATRELMKVKAELGATIDLLDAAKPRRDASVVREVLEKRLPVIHRRTGRALNLLNRRSTQGTGKTPLAQAPPVSAPVSGLLAPVSGSMVDWARLRSGINSSNHTYGSIARAIGKGTKGRAAVHLVVSRKTKSGPVFDLVCRWAAVEGYLKNKSKGSTP